jgi:hypothetical protein
MQLFMKTRIKNLLLLMLLLGLPAVVQAQNAFSTNADGSIYTYSTNADGSANIVAYAGPPWVVTIPTNINGLTVTSIGVLAFESDTSLTSVTIPGSVSTIGFAAFHYCTSLANATIGDGVTSIGNNAFEACFDLAGITIPDSVTSIGEEAFDDCTSLANATIGDSVTNIGGEAFENCESLATVLFQGNAPPGGDSTVFADDNMAKVYYYQGATGWSSTFDGRPTKMLPPPPPPPPPFTAGGIQLSGSNVILTATNGLSGAACYVLMSTSLALPLSQWTPIATNVLDSSGAATITLTNAAAAGAMQSFYILQQ